MRLSGAQLNWLLRLVELPFVLIVSLIAPPDGSRGLFLGALSVAAAAWIGWLLVRPWESADPASGPAGLTLMTIVAAAAGFAMAIGGWSVLLAIVVVLHAGATLRARAAAVPIACLAGVVAGHVAGAGATDLAAGILPLICGVFLAGVLRGYRRRQLRQARMLLAQQQETQAERERAAALAERTRIAREIHDILAHSLGDLAIQLEVADALLTDGGDRTGALDRVRYAHRLAGSGLAETRRAVHALRSDAPPLPDALAAMVGAYRDGSGDASFEVTGTPRPLPAAAGLALVRAAQEALVNARRHAAGSPVTVLLDYGPERTRLTIRDGPSEAGPPRDAPSGDAPSGDAPSGDASSGAGPAGGHGLAGMRERLRLVGGSLTAGPLAEGWRVRAEVPS
jgi:signal transduction histidine kinase